MRGALPSRLEIASTDSPCNRAMSETRSESVSAAVARWSCSAKAAASTGVGSSEASSASRSRVDSLPEPRAHPAAGEGHHAPDIAAEYQVRGIALASLVAEEQLTGTRALDRSLVCCRLCAAARGVLPGGREFSRGMFGHGPSESG